MTDADYDEFKSRVLKADFNNRDLSIGEIRVVSMQGFQYVAWYRCAFRQGITGFFPCRALAGYSEVYGLQHAIVHDEVIVIATVIDKAKHF